MIRIALVCGGPGPERGVSLNSARCVMDHLDGGGVEIVPIYVDQKCRFYEISKGQLYSNTPSDFDFILDKRGKRIERISGVLSKQVSMVDLCVGRMLESSLTTVSSGSVLRAACKSAHINQFGKNSNGVDLVFPVIHGIYGEDGQLQRQLEAWGLKYVGSGAESCELALNKYRAREAMAAAGYEVLECVLLREEEDVRKFFERHHKGVIKPAIGGSSIGVYVVEGVAEGLMRYKALKKVYDELIIEPMLEGREFTVTLIAGKALMPTEIEYDGGIFDYRKKYLPTSNTFYHSPCRFGDQVIAHIQRTSESLYKLFDLKDFARMDGWVLADGRILFTDINPISGMDQNSFLFRQAGLEGMTHRDVLEQVVESACARYGIHFKREEENIENEREVIRVLFGGKTAERQVSLMSGTNVWLKLNRSKKFKAEPYFYDFNGDVWKLPYSYALSHTVEEIYKNCIGSRVLAKQVSMADLERWTLDEFLEESGKLGAFVFNGLHGGEGEDGRIQELMDKYEVIYNGSGPEASQICMDKFRTGEIVNALGLEGVWAMKKYLLDVREDRDVKQMWKEIKESINSDYYIIKPRSDGCSAGIVKLRNLEDFEKYIAYVKSGVAQIAKEEFEDQGDVIEMSSQADTEYIIEGFIQTDRIGVRQQKLEHEDRGGWVELTVGVMEVEGRYAAFNPSITVAEGAVLSLEEKFQGGTGVNLTPPPQELISGEGIRRIKEVIEAVSRGIGIENYCRIDIFFNIKTNEVIVIEFNTLPALTPSTVLYHQALSEEDSIRPVELLEKLIESKKLSLVKEFL